MPTLFLPTDEPDALTRPRLLLAAKLRDLRERNGVTSETAGAAIGSLPLLETMEQGLTASDPHHVMALASLYELTDHAARLHLLQLAISSRQEGWWKPYHHLINPWFLPYLGAEQSAELIRCYAVGAIPDLLQHSAYAASMIRGANRAVGEVELAQRLELRLRRQRVLYERHPPRLWAIIDETALRRCVGTPEITYRQLDHLLDLCELPHVTVQIIPLSVGQDLPRGPFTLVRVLRDPDVRQVTYLQQFERGYYFEDQKRAQYAMDLLAIVAEPPAHTPPLLRRMISAL
ncbi:helix-turn-helix domain-containing protein [Actinomadura terrae]|uniref:helix-turn-helix domain-containing protein n=1 Tax=Actinomadura terrae TaxID=604353 RepID=UPI001FA76C54|nr:helix-turn-helix transcriptional regulator [Actinomadura terrae]